MMIARKSFLIVISQFIIQFIGWIGLVIIAKLWGGFAPEALGTIGFAMSFLALFNIVADLGFRGAHVKRVSEGQDLGTCIGTYAAIKLILTGLMVTIIVTAIFIWKNVFQQGFTDATTESMIFVFIIYYIFSNLSSIAIITFTGTREIVKRELPDIFGKVVKLPLIILVALAGVGTAGISPLVEWPHFLQPLQQLIANHAASSLAITYVINAMVLFFIGLWLLRKYPIKRPNWGMFKSYFSFALPMMTLSFFSIISINVDKLMIGYFWTSVEVGYYFTVQRILGVITILYIGVNTVLFPTLSEYHSYNNFEKIKKTTHLAERYISMVMIPPIVIIIIFANPIIGIMLSNAFLPAAPVLIILAIYAFILGLRAPYGSLISGINRPSIAAKIGITICITNISLNYLFIPKWGLLSNFGINGPTGAATATVISCIVGFFGMRIMAKKLTGIKLLQSHTPRHITAGVIMAVILYCLNFLFPLIRWYHILGSAGVGLAIYLGVLFITQEFKKEDLIFFLGLLHPKEMFKYVSSELRKKPK